MARGVSIYGIAVDSELLNLVVRFGGLVDVDDREAVVHSLGVTLRKGLSLLIQDAAKKIL